MDMLLAPVCQRVRRVEDGRRRWCDLPIPARGSVAKSTEPHPRLAIKLFRSSVSFFDNHAFTPLPLSLSKRLSALSSLLIRKLSEEGCLMHMLPPIHTLVLHNKHIRLNCHTTHSVSYLHGSDFISSPPEWLILPVCYYWIRGSRVLTKGSCGSQKSRSWSFE